ncbi:MAG: biotin/lipoyl-binding protein [Chloroflexota bacterium]|nr:biotin/lipoyl-binding protein [Chloroflexota bacterium]
MLRRKRRRWILVVLVLVAAVAGGYYYWASRPQKQEAEESQVPTARVRRGDLVLAATGSGSLIPADERSLSFGVGGTVTEVNVEAGDEVKDGDVLARIDDSDAREALINAQVQATKAEADLQSTLLDHEELLKGASEAELLDALIELLASKAA